MSKILIVDDNAVNIYLTKILIKKILPESIIFEATDGNDAVRICHENDIDMVFMDVQMPNMNGYEATKAIRNQVPTKQITIIGLTAGVMVGEKEKCLEAGMDEYLGKPIIKENIVNIVNKWLTLPN